MLPSPEQLQTAARQFQYEGAVKSITPFGHGHINDTFLCACVSPDGSDRQYALQNINTHVFHWPERVMHNIERVTNHLREKLLGMPGSNPDRETLSIVPALDGRTYHRCGELVWRSYTFIHGATTVDVVHTNEQAYEAARAFAKFQRLLDDLPGPRLWETIPHFHHTPKRLHALERAIEEDRHNRAAGCKEDIHAALRHHRLSPVIVEALESGAIPERITHNDTKINNILFDGETGHVCCVIDLDTVMPGSSLYDFGDMVRTSTGEFEENERDLSQVDVKVDRFEALVRGYLEEAGSFLQRSEIELLVLSGMLITYEIGLRFLTDHLEGDQYFKIDRPGENLDRARTQFRFVDCLQAKREALEAIVARYAAG